MKLLLLSLALLTSVGSTALAFPDSVEMEANFQTCSQEPGWMSSWGMFVVSYDKGEASRICRQGNETYRVAACRKGFHFLYAGYYCQDVSPGQ